MGNQVANKWDNLGVLKQDFPFVVLNRKFLGMGKEIIRTGNKKTPSA